MYCFYFYYYYNYNNCCSITPFSAARIDAINESWGSVKGTLDHAALWLADIIGNLSYQLHIVRTWPWDDREILVLVLVAPMECSPDKCLQATHTVYTVTGHKGPPARPYCHIYTYSCHKGVKEEQPPSLKKSCWFPSRGVALCPVLIHTVVRHLFTSVCVGCSSTPGWIPIYGHCYGGVQISTEPPLRLSMSAWLTYWYYFFQSLQVTSLEPQQPQWPTSW